MFAPFSWISEAPSDFAGEFRFSAPEFIENAYPCKILVMRFCTWMQSRHFGGSAVQPQHFFLFRLRLWDTVLFISLQSVPSVRSVVKKFFVVNTYTGKVISMGIGKIVVFYYVFK